MVRAKEVEEKGASLPFLTDLTLSLSVLVASNLSVLYAGKKITQVREDINKDGYS